MSNFNLSVTGHRPNKLWGYDYNDVHYQNLQTRFEDIVKNLLQSYDTVTMYSGMAIGVDTIFALAALHLKSEGYPVRLICAVPFVGQECRWNRQTQQLYNSIKSMADEVVVVCSGSYAPWKMQKRNEYLVDNCDELIAVWDGSSGGTGNCVSYATSKNTPMVHIVPSEV